MPRHRLVKTPWLRAVIDRQHHFGHYEAPGLLVMSTELQGLHTSTWPGKPVEVRIVFRPTDGYGHRVHLTGGDCGEYGVDEGDLVFLPAMVTLKDGLSREVVARLSLDSDLGKWLERRMKVGATYEISSDQRGGWWDSMDVPTDVVREYKIPRGSEWPWGSERYVMVGENPESWAAALLKSEAKGAA